MSLRVIQWATGGVGRAAIEGVLSHPELELVGCWVHGDAKHGRDVGEIAGTDPIGVTATTDEQALLELDADCVYYSPVVADRRALVRILESGKNVVTPLNWFYQGRREWADLVAACETGGVTLHGTGINPGGATERFPLMFSALSREVRHVRIEEWSDILTYGAPDVVANVMQFGKPPEVAKQSPMVKLLGDGFVQSIEMVADELGFALDPEKRVSHEVSTATRPIDSPIGVIEAGLVAAQRFTWEGLVRGEPVVTVRTNWFMGEEGFEAGWSFGPKGERYEIEIRGDPPSLVTLEGWQARDIAAGLERNAGVVATAIHGVSAIPATCRAEPGIKNYLDLPLVAGRAAPDLTEARE